MIQKANHQKLHDTPYQTVDNFEEESSDTFSDAFFKYPKMSVEMYSPKELELLTS